MKKTFLNLISAYALNILRRNLVDAGYIEKSKIKSVNPESEFKQDIKIIDFMDNYEIIYFMENNFDILLPDEIQLTTAGALCDQTAKIFYEKNKTKLNAIVNHIAQDIVNMTYNTPAIHDSVPALDIARKQKVSDVLSKSTPDYDFDLLLKSIKSKYNVENDDFYTNITTIDSLITFVALEIEKANRHKKRLTQTKHTINNAYDNSRQQIMNELASDLQTCSLVDTDKKHPLSLSTKLQFKNYIDYVALYNIAISKYNVEIEKSALFKMKTVNDYCYEIMKKRIAMFQQTKTQIKKEKKMTNLKPNSKKTLVSFDDVLETLKIYIEEETSLIPEEIKPSDRLSYDLDLDSLHRLEMIIRLEQVYGVEINETEDLERAHTLADFAILCQDQINQGKVVAETLKTTNEKIIPSPHTKNVNKIATNIQTQMTAVKPVENSLLQRIKSAFVKSK